MTYSVSKEDVKKCAQKIEELAKNIQNQVDNNADFMVSANELSITNMTMVFALGEVYAAENLKAVKATKVGFYNKRDSKGRFVKV